MRCPSCKEKINKEDDVCFNCGYPIGLGKAHSIDTYAHTHESASFEQQVHIEEQTTSPRVEPVPSVIKQSKSNQTGKKKSGAGAFLSVLGVLIFMAIRWFGDDGFDRIKDLDFESQDDVIQVTEEPYLNLYDEVYDDLIIIQYTYEDSLGNPWLFFEIENTSDYDVYMDVYLDTYDADGNMIDDLIMSVYTLEKDTVTLVPFVLESWYEEAWFDVGIWEADYEGHASDFVVAHKKTQDGETVVITNEGDEAVFFLEAKVLFFKDGVVVNYSTNYFTDEDSEIKPGATISERYYCYDTYDEVKIYIVE